MYHILRVRPPSEKAQRQPVNLLRITVDIVLLGTIVLVRDLIPFSFELALVGTAAALSIVNIVFAFKMAAKK